MPVETMMAIQIFTCTYVCIYTNTYVCHIHKCTKLNYYVWKQLIIIQQIRNIVFLIIYINSRAHIRHYTYIHMYVQMFIRDICTRKRLACHTLSFCNTTTTGSSVACESNCSERWSENSNLHRLIAHYAIFMPNLFGGRMKVGAPADAEKVKKMECAKKKLQANNERVRYYLLRVCMYVCM